MPGRWHTPITRWRIPRRHRRYGELDNTLVNLHPGRQWAPQSEVVRGLLNELTFFNGRPRILQ